MVDFQKIERGRVLSHTPVSPKSLGYRMPAEWEMQSAVWLSWPHNMETWQSLSMLGKVEESYVEFFKALHTGQKVKILVNDEETKKRIAAKLRKADVSPSQAIFYKIKTADAWIRDYGPTFVLSSSSKEELAIVKWKFNAWGDKYGELKQDDSVPYEISKVMRLPVFDAGIVMEGGSIEVNGSGTLLTTEQCLLNKNRNPGAGKAEIEERLKNCLNASNILWLKSGIAGDDTDGHVDDIARFINKNTVACAFEENKGDENYEALKENYALLSKMRDEDGNKLNIIKLPMPEPLFSDGKSSERLPASYANFYIGNEVVAVPVFGSKSDAKAIKILQRLFPARKVVGINCRAMVHGLGALHCASQQEPMI